VLDDILKRLNAMPEKARAELTETAIAATAGMKFIPSPGPQTDAYLSKADLLLYGGEPGGGKTSLAAGLALNEHENSLLMRRQYTDLTGLTDEAIKFHGSRDGFNGSSPPKLVHERGRIEFGACARPGDEQSWMGRPRDLLYLDEATQFTEMQVRFLRGWVRTTTPGQRARTILGTNPPLSADGAWVFKMFAPWLDPQHPNPAKPGELRWFVTDEDDNDIEVEGPGEYDVGAADGKMRTAESRTYIPSKLSDNPFLAGTDYQKRLDALPAEVRKILLGGFRASFQDAPMQTIPTAWIEAAQARWTPQRPYGVPMCAMGVDCSGGGKDPLIVAKRYDGYYQPIERIEGKDLPKERIGSHSAGIVLSFRKDDADVVVDMGGGYGSGLYETLLDNIESRFVIAYKGAEGSLRRTKDGKLKFKNQRSQAIWQFREALDPDQDGGSPIALPKDPELVADLTAPTFKVTSQGIVVESKEDVCDRLDRSTDKGDAVVMAWFSGQKYVTPAQGDSAEQGGRRRGGGLQVSLGPRHAHRR
jgi:hypothetical protein